ncbi:MAG: hypothetical protein KDJ27_21775, partial [Gammaproteobacteria bacterium]|nr:hypothetical protein [Gammaproteobacteria bacterium]
RRSGSPHAETAVGASYVAHAKPHIVDTRNTTIRRRVTQCRNARRTDVDLINRMTAKRYCA